MTILSLIDYIVLTALALSAIAISWAIADYLRMAQDTESEGWDLPPIDEPLPYRITEGFEARQELIRNSNLDEA